MTTEEWDEAVAALGPRPEPELQQWSIPCRVTYSTTVTVEARTAGEALSKVDALDWVDDGHSGASTVNWDVVGPPEAEG